jgi:hypothetical protein
LQPGQELEQLRGAHNDAAELAQNVHDVQPELLHLQDT